MPFNVRLSNTNLIVSLSLYSLAKVQLKLTCSNSVAAVEVNTPNGDTTLRSTDVRGKCISADWSDTSNPLTEVCEL